MHPKTADELIADGAEQDLTLHVIEFDPRNPAGYRFAAEPGTIEADQLATVLRPDPIPWPTGLEPTPQTITPPPASTDPLPQADVLVVTYTVAEGYALADILTPGVETSAWTEYKNGWPALRQLITGHRAPALSYGRAGLWHTTMIGDITVIVFKSDLHPATDGPNLPIATLWTQLIGQVQPRLVITTGTAGAVQADTLLGDIIVARHLTFDCTASLADKPYAHTEYTATTAFQPGEYDTAAEQLIPVNATRLPPAARQPRIWRDTDTQPAQTITTDFFAFDDAADHYGLRAYDPKARAVEMDDAALGLAISQLTDPPEWVSIRNASDPQMTGGDLPTEKQQAATIYEQYGQITSWGSAITCWATIVPLTTH